jgi:hypothetical protein
MWAIPVAATLLSGLDGKDLIAGMRGGDGFLRGSGGLRRPTFPSLPVFTPYSARKEDKAD